MNTPKPFRRWISLLLLAACVSQSAAQDHPTAEERRTRLQKAEAMFQERCKRSGEFIKRTVDNVEGIYLLKLRPNGINRGDQFAMDDPYGHDSGGETYIKIFFAEFYRTPSNPPAGWMPRRGYRYVEAIDPKGGNRYRYTGRTEEPWQYDKHYLKGYTRFVLDKAPAPGAAPRYGVTYDDISTREEREYWIAGSSLKVIDLKSNEVIAERIGYIMDRGQGSSIDVDGGVALGVRRKLGADSC